MHDDADNHGFLISSHVSQQEWNIFKVLKVKHRHPQILCPLKIFFRNEDEMKIFSDKGKQKEFTSS